MQIFLTKLLNLFSEFTTSSGPCQGGKRSYGSYNKVSLCLFMFPWITSICSLSILFRRVVHRNPCLPTCSKTTLSQIRYTGQVRHPIGKGDVGQVEKLHAVYKYMQVCTRLTVPENSTQMVILFFYSIILTDTIAFCMEPILLDLHLH